MKLRKEQPQPTMSCRHGDVCCLLEEVCKEPRLGDRKYKDMDYKEEGLMAARNTTLNR